MGDPDVRAAGPREGALPAGAPAPGDPRSGLWGLFSSAAVPAPGCEGHGGGGLGVRATGHGEGSGAAGSGGGRGGGGGNVTSGNAGGGGEELPLQSPVATQTQVNSEAGAAGRAGGGPSGRAAGWACGGRAGTALPATQRCKCDGPGRGRLRARRASPGSKAAAGCGREAAVSARRPGSAAATAPPVLPCPARPGPARPSPPCPGPAEPPRCGSNVPVKVPEARQELPAAVRERCPSARGRFQFAAQRGVPSFRPRVPESPRRALPVSFPRGGTGPRSALSPAVEGRDLGVEAGSGIRA